MSFTFASWNVEAFRGDNIKRLEALTAWLAYAHPEQKPIDVFGILEVEGAQLLGLAQRYFPDYDFFLTDGQQNKEIIIGVRRDTFAQVTFTQRREFQAGNVYMRPGSLVSVRPKGAVSWVHLLFLHAPAMSDPDGFGARMKVFEHVGRLKALFDKGEQMATGDPEAEAQIIALGDLNTAGLRYPSQRKGDQRVTSEDEIASLETLTGLSLMLKGADETWTGGRGESDLDHVLISNSVKLRSFGRRDDGKTYSVAVRGWPELEGSQRKNFAENISDHALIVGEAIYDEQEDRPLEAPKKKRGFFGLFGGR